MLKLPVDLHWANKICGRVPSCFYFTPRTCTCSKLTRCCMNVKVWWSKQHQCTNTSIKLRYWSHVGVDFSSLHAGITLKWKTTIQEKLYFVSTGPFLRQYKKYNMQKTLGSRSSNEEYTKCLLVSPFVSHIVQYELFITSHTQWQNPYLYLYACQTICFSELPLSVFGLS